MKSFKNITLFISCILISIGLTAQSQKDIVDLASGLKEHTTLVKAIKAADLVSTLKGEGPFTVFAPTNNAFEKLPAGTLTELLEPMNKSKLSTILTYHVVSGSLNSNAILAAIKKGGGKAILTTVAGVNLTATFEKGKVLLTDEKGNIATVTATNIKASNGVIHVINKVLLPNN